jgi:hypothetical protein
MNTFLLLSVLAQVTSPRATGVVAVERAPLNWSDGRRSYKLWESPVLVAEPGPTEARGAVLRSLGATLVVDRPTMRVWKVTDAPAVRAKVPELRAVLHDNRQNTGRYRVPLALVCRGERLIKPWLEVLEASGADCLPDFWYLPVLR